MTASTQAGLGKLTTQRQILIMARKCLHWAKISKNIYSFIPKLQNVVTLPLMEDLQSQYLVALSYFS